MEWAREKEDSVRYNGKMCEEREDAWENTS